jgi:hypothetical protein
LSPGRIALRNDKEMGRKGKWFSSVKKALSPESKEKTDQVWRNHKMVFFDYLEIGLI